MNILKQFFFVSGTACLFVSCGNATANVGEVDADQYFERELENPIRPDEPTVANPNLISENGVLGISPGASVLKLGDKLEKGTLENEADRFQVYHIKDAAGERVGYALPGRKDPTRVGDIVITSRRFIDGKGISIGGTWGALKTAYPDIVAYGTKTSARVYAVNSPIRYLLDYANSEYEFDNGDIPDNARITKIELRK